MHHSNCSLTSWSQKETASNQPIYKREGIVIDHFLEMLLKFIGKVVHTIGKEKVKEQISEFAVETTVEIAEEKLLHKHSSPEAKSNKNFQEFLEEMTQDGLVVLAGICLVFTIFGAVCLLTKDLFGERFFFHFKNIIYVFEFVLVFFFLFFVPSATVGKAAPVFQRLHSRKVRGWSAFIVFVLLFFAISWLAGKVFPSYSEVLVKRML